MQKTTNHSNTYQYCTKWLPILHTELSTVGRYIHLPLLLIKRSILYNYRLLMRSTHDHEDCIRYWLTDAEGGGQPMPDKVFMVMSRPKSKVYYCFIKLSGILHKD